MTATEVDQTLPLGDRAADDAINTISTMFITANVGSIFEDSKILELWVKQLKQDLSSIKPQFVALHCQEIGGKNYEKSMEHVTSFIQKLLDDKDLAIFDRMMIFLDEDYTCSEKFTALGSLYFIHGSLYNIKLWNFQSNQFEAIKGRQVFSGNIEHVDHIEKVKFPQSFFPECRWSRKGFMRTRWLFKDQQLDLINIHLFHDASNFIAMENNPSQYAQNRQRALEYTLNKISMPIKDCKSNDNNNVEQDLEEGQQQNHNYTKSDIIKDGEPVAKKPSLDPSISDNHGYRSSAQDAKKNLDGSNGTPFFIFGDFNFRLDTSRVIEKITKGTAPTMKMSAKNDEVEEMIYKEVTTNDIIMTVGKKTFDCDNLDETFHGKKNTHWLLELDNELDKFKEQLHEFDISFSPSYPFREDFLGGHSYMKTRCPAWCDRILFNELGRNLVCGVGQHDNIGSDPNKTETNISFKKDVLYTLMGTSVPMGDHKPVLLHCRIHVGPGCGCKENLLEKISQTIEIS